MKERVLGWLAGDGLADDAAFDAAALELFAWQRAHNPDYAAFCDGAEPSGWREIPAVPVGLFRDLALTCFPPEQAVAVFRTSGTTTGRRGEHRLADTDAYDLGAARHAIATVGPIPPVGVGLVPTEADSSLGHMCRLLCPGLRSFFSSDGIDAAGAWAALREAAEPQFVPGTAFGFALLLAGGGEPVTLPAGSVAMVTGGFKGRVTEVSEDRLLGDLVAALPGCRIVGEYGMTELSSQLWAGRFGEPYGPPPWMRVVAVDPLSGRALPAGTAGQLRFVDLANHWTVLAIESQDLGTVDPLGRVRYLGRLPGAPVRGCSLSVEEAP